MTRRPIILLFRRSGLPFLLLGALLLLGGGWYTVTAVMNTNNLKEKVIVIDPGHGGQDPGAQFGGIKEKDINLDIALRLREILSASGCKVILTREVDKDFYLPNFVLGRMAKRAELSQRVRMASMSQADLFISIHANSYPGGYSYGMETYHHVKSPAGKALAERIQTELKNVQPDNKRAAKSGDYYLLNQTQMPAVLVEVGFLSNSKERKLLQNSNYQEQIAKAISAGIGVYFHDYPHGIQETSPVLAESKGPALASQSSFKLYYPALNADQLIAEERHAGPAWGKLDTPSKLQIILNELLKGPKNSQEYFPIQSAELLNIQLQNGIATLNFSDSLRRGFSGGAAEEEMAIKALVWSTAQVGNISGVKILINGEKGESIGGHVPLNQTFTTQVPNARIALVIDDFGINNPGTAEMLDLKIPLTAAVMPNLMFSSQEAELIHQKGYEIILHMPMEPKNGSPTWLGPGALKANQPPETLRHNLDQALESVRYAIGVSNHMGSKATEDEQVVQTLVEVAKAHQLLVLDSKTSEATKLYREAQKSGLPTGMRDVFLDNSNDLGAIKKQIRILIELAKKNGKAIGIGHVGPQGPTTARAIREMLPELQKEGIQIVPLSELLNQP